MLIGFLLPLLRRFSARTRMLVAVAVMAAGLALALIVLLRGHAGGQVLLIRWGLLATVAGLGLLIGAVRGGRRGRRRRDDDVTQPADRP